MQTRTLDISSKRYATLFLYITMLNYPDYAISALLALTYLPNTCIVACISAQDLPYIRHFEIVAQYLKNQPVLGNT